MQLGIAEAGTAESVELVVSYAAGKSVFVAVATGFAPVVLGGTDHCSWLCCFA